MSVNEFNTVIQQKQKDGSFAKLYPITKINNVKDDEGKNLGEELILCSTMLRAEGDLFLDGMTPEELSERLDCNIAFTEENAESFLYSVLGLE